MAKMIKTEKARQGRARPNMLVVVVVGLVLACIAWFGVAEYGRSIAPATDKVSTSTNSGAG